MKKKKINNYPSYLIYEDGRVFSKKANRFLKQSVYKKNGYRYLDLYDGHKRKKFLIHRLVAQAFIPNPENKPQVNHKNGNKLDNSVQNLEWCTSKENIRHAIRNSLMLIGEKNGRSVLSDKQVRIIRHAFNMGCKSKQLSRFFNVSDRNIRFIVKNKTRIFA